MFATTSILPSATGSRSKSNSVLCKNDPYPHLQQGEGHPKDPNWQAKSPCSVEQEVPLFKEYRKPEHSHSKFCHPIKRHIDETENRAPKNFPPSCRRPCFICDLMNTVMEITDIIVIWIVLKTYIKKYTSSIATPLQSMP